MTEEEMNAHAEDVVKRAFSSLCDLLEHAPRYEFIPNFTDGFLLGCAYGLTRERTETFLENGDITRQEARALHCKTSQVLKRQKEKLRDMMENSDDC